MRRGAAAHRVLAAGSFDDEWTSPFHDAAAVDTKLLVAVAVKFADLGHSCKPTALHEMWTDRVTEEYALLASHAAPSATGLGA